jgi:hypothetical protein
MNESPDRPPYFEWRMDLWKLTLLILLFATLLLWAVLGGG